MPSFDTDCPPSVAVVEAVAAREGVEPETLTHPLDAVVDVDALDSIFAPRGSGAARDGGQISFTYYGYHVTVHSSGSVLLDADGPALEL